jgi:hypothetical protein
MEDRDILDHNVGGQTIREMSALGFCSWVATKINSLDAYTPAVQELSGLVSNPPLARMMPEQSKLRYVRAMMALGIKI